MLTRCWLYTHKIHSRNIFWCSVDGCKTSQLHWCFHSRAERFWSTGPVTYFLCVLCWLVQNITVAPVFPHSGAKRFWSTGPVTESFLVLYWLVQNITVTSVFPQSRVKRFWSTSPVTAEFFLVLYWHILGALLTVQIITMALVSPHSGAKRFQSTGPVMNIEKLVPSLINS